MWYSIFTSRKNGLNSVEVGGEDDVMYAEGTRKGGMAREGKRQIDWHSVCDVFQQVRSGINGPAWLVVVKIHPLSPSHSLQLSVSTTDPHIHTCPFSHILYILLWVFLFAHFYAHQPLSLLSVFIASYLYFRHRSCLLKASSLPHCQCAATIPKNNCDQNTPEWINTR